MSYNELLSTDKEVLDMVADGLRNYFYSQAGPDTTKSRIESQVDHQMLNMTSKIARRVCGISIHNLSLEPNKRLTILEAIQQAKRNEQ